MSTIKSSNEHLTINADGANKDIKFQANGVEKASIDSSGNLTVSGNLTSAGIDDNADATAITIDSSENVGIGVTPESWDSQYTAQQIGEAGAVAYGDDGNFLEVGNNFYGRSAPKRIQADYATKYEQQDGKHNWYVAGTSTADSAINWTTAMTIENDGDILISATARPSSSVTGASFFPNTYPGNHVELYMSSGSTSSTNQISFLNPNGIVGVIKTSGSSTSYNTSSDYRLKENVEYDWDATTRLKQLKPARFNFIVDDTTTVDGFLAHEVSDIVPEAISGEKDAMTEKVLYVEGDDIPEGKSVGDVKEASVIDPQGIDQSKLVPLLVKTIQELEARITTLENA